MHAVSMFVSLFTLVIYRLYLHPLSHIPGPRIWALSIIPRCYTIFRGRLPYRIAEIHDKYGPVVRIAPAEVSFINNAWNDIYGKQPGQPQLGRDPKEWFVPPDSDIGLGVFPLDDVSHTRIRRNFAVAFSDKALREQAPVLVKYVEKLIYRLHEKFDKPLNMVDWYNFTTFDTTGDLTFGESFGCLETSTLHDWVKMIFGFVAGSAYLGVTQHFIFITPIIVALIPKRFTQEGEKHLRATQVRLDKRLKMEKTRSDFMTPTLNVIDKPDGITYGEVLESARSIMTGGSETTATCLCASTYYLCKNPTAMAAIQAEIRNAFQSANEITPAAASNLKYTNAVLEEAMRLLPPLPGGLRRITSPHGNMIAGTFIPPRTSVSVDLFAAGRSLSNFTKPLEFHPSRWLPSPLRPPEFDMDNRKVMQNFSVGPRACPGKKLGYTMMALILARVIWEFDLELMEDSWEWGEDMKVVGMYVKGELNIKVTPARR
ncbi:cytochrome P450 [Tricladium varicosporioides]|nr:cytochrome P450 [Hymenoscyphus varicosporioides]